MGLIYGRKPVVEAIQSGASLEAVYIQKEVKSFPLDRIAAMARERGIPVRFAPKEKFRALGDVNSQGIFAYGSSVNYSSVDEVIKNAKAAQYPLILILDSIQDTGNLGAILRSAECAGVGGVLITENQSAPVNSTVEKTSAGAVSYLDIAKIHNLSQSLALLKKEGFWVIGSHLEGAQNYAKTDYRMPVALIVGNEEKGMHRLVKENCDILVKIPMEGSIQSLNASVAAGVLLFEILRQRSS